MRICRRVKTSQKHPWTLVLSCLLRQFNVIKNAKEKRSLHLFGQTRRCFLQYLFWNDGTRNFNVIVAIVYLLRALKVCELARSLRAFTLLIFCLRCDGIGSNKINKNISLQHCKRREKSKLNLFIQRFSLDLQYKGGWWKDAFPFISGFSFQYSAKL